nr:hypothetical protein [Tanacetum cinerariifolium]
MPWWRVAVLVMEVAAVESFVGVVVKAAGKWPAAAGCSGGAGVHGGEAADGVVMVAVGVGCGSGAGCHRAAAAVGVVAA